MAKAKPQKEKAIPHKALHSRIAYLHKAANYLATAAPSSGNATPECRPKMTEDSKSTLTPCDPLHNLTRQMASDLWTVSMKMQIRLTPAVKHSICRRCNTPQLEGSTCTTILENSSKGGKKPWAEVTVKWCNACGAAKRVPTGAKRQPRRPARPQKPES
jgi:ribonuclease P protein subunit RPR2